MTLARVPSAVELQNGHASGRERGCVVGARSIVEMPFSEDVATGADSPSIDGEPIATQRVHAPTSPWREKVRLRRREPECVWSIARGTRRCPSRAGAHSPHGARAGPAPSRARPQAPRRWRRVRQHTRLSHLRTDDNRQPKLPGTSHHTQGPDEPAHLRNAHVHDPVFGTSREGFVLLDSHEILIGRDPVAWTG
jgi:hypothetical protein